MQSSENTQPDGPSAFELRRQWVGIFAGPLLALLCYAFFSNLPPTQRRLSAILVLVIVYWITEAIPIPVTSLIGPSLCILLGIAGARDVFKAFADPIIFVFIGSFVIARAMSVNGLDRRVALAVLGSPSIGASPRRIRIALGGFAAVLSMWMSNTAVAAILFPITVGICDALMRACAGDAAGSRMVRSYATGMMLMVAYSASIGGLGTPVGTPPNLIGIAMVEDLAGSRIPFFQWMLAGVPIMAVMFLALCVLLELLHPSPREKLMGMESIIADLKRDAPAWGKAQTCTLLSFLVAVCLWIFPGIVALLQGSHSPLYEFLGSRLHEGVVALIAAALLFLIPVRWKPLQGAVAWNEAVDIDWGTILLFGGGLSLGGLMHSSGLAGRFAQGMLGSQTAPGLWTITMGATLFAVLITETTSNTAAASMVVPVAIAVAKTAGVSPVPPAVGATIGASLAFMLPVSTPPNAIMYGSGRISILQMLRAGTLLDVAGYFVVILLLMLLCPMLGWS